MIGHQLDLFGGPLKPPKKIKVDDEDIPVDEPKADDFPRPEGEMPETLEAEQVPVDVEIAEPGPITQEEVIISNGIEGPQGFDEPVEEEIQKEEAEVPEQPADLADPRFKDEAETVPFEENTFTNEASFTNEIIEEAVDEQPLPDVIEEVQDEEDIPELVEIKEEDAGQETIPSASSPISTALTKRTEDEDGLNIPPDEELFKRQYYSMRETSAMFGVNQSLLRFWENEFDILQPKKNKKGDRYFRPVDIKNLVLIHHLLRVRKFTLEGAKDYLNSNKKAADSFELVRRLEKLKSFLLELKAGL